jgi:phosphate transport system substrate-binding protein
MKGSPMRVLRTLLAFSVFALVALLGAAAGSPAQAANAHQLIQGSGSSWAANAVTQWIADVHQNGLQVVFSSNGSAQGRTDFANKTVDFGVSDIGYQGEDPVTHANDSSNGRAFAYLPIVAGGTSLPYNLVVNGKRVTNLRLSGSTIARIFTQSSSDPNNPKITMWNDPAITKDNNGKALPPIPIIPVQHSEGSGSSYQFTRYLSKEFPKIWTKGATEYFPQATGAAVAENGSDGVMNYLTSPAANGAIAFDEYSYALGKGFPVVKVLNQAGYFTLPNQYNVAVALTKAKIDPTTLLQNLDNVYVDPDNRAYPISSYSYAIIPTGKTDATMNTAKRQTLADYLDYSICQGQAEMGKIGYSPLPLNLVQASFARIRLLHTADSGVDISDTKPQACNNPTFDPNNLALNRLAEVAPKPEACDKIGAGPCTDSGNTGQANPTKSGTVAVTGNQSSGGTSSTGGSNSTGGSSSTGGGGSSGSGGSAGGASVQGGNTGTGNLAGTTTTAGGTTTSGGTGSGGIDPNTGQATSSGGGSSAGDAEPAAQTIAGDQSRATDVSLGIIAALILLGVLIAPPLIAGALARRRDGA